MTELTSCGTAAAMAMAPCRTDSEFRLEDAEACCCGWPGVGVPRREEEEGGASSEWGCCAEEVWTLLLVVTEVRCIFLGRKRRGGIYGEVLTAILRKIGRSDQC